MLGLLPAVTCLLLFSQPGSSSTSDGDGTVVKTTSGPIQGRRLSAGSGTVTAFLGIPYAEPPLEALRFQKPLPHKPWTNILDTTSFRSPCPQPPLIGWPDSSMWVPTTPYSEDCLFLNIWVPHPRPSSPVPILIWIHGGGFFMSASSLDLYDGRYLATTESVIVASMNYRLGALGFLSLPPAAPGNAGLWDQQLALHWLRDNAAAFGGDLNRLTLFGQSAGGASIDFHLLSPSSRPLFSRAIIQSGASNSTWAWIDPEEARQRVQTLGLLLGCPEANDIALVRCLQGKEVGEILKHQKSIGRRQSLLHLSFVPTIDGDFLPDVPWKLVKAGRNQSMPILVGFTTNEGANLLISSYFPFDVEDASQIGREKLLKVLGQMLQGTPEHVIEAIALQYSPAEQGTTRYRWAMEQIINDMLIACGVVDVAQRESEAQSPVYAYTFGYRPRKLSSPEWTGVPHGSDLLFLFGTQAAGNQNFTEAEAALSRRVMWYWAEFARSGNPTGAGSSGEQWPPYTTTEQNFLRISMEEPRVASPSPAQRCGFLMSLIMKQLEVPTGSSLPRTSTSSGVCLDGKAHVQNSAPWIPGNPRAEETCEELRPT